MERRVKRVTSDSQDPTGSHPTSRSLGPHHQRTIGICTREKRGAEEIKGYQAPTQKARKASWDSQEHGVFLALMEKKESLDRKEAEAWMVSKVPADPEGPRENVENKAPRDPLSTRPIHPWQKVPEVTQDSQGLMGNQEVEASLETLAPWGPKVHLLEIKIR